MLIFKTVEYEQNGFKCFEKTKSSIKVNVFLKKMIKNRIRDKRQNELKVIT